MALTEEIIYTLRCNGVDTFGPMHDNCHSAIGPSRDSVKLITQGAEAGWDVTRADGTVYCSRHKIEAREPARPAG